MPLYWVIDSRERLMVAVAEGGVTMEEAVAYLDAMDGARAGSYRRLFDGSEGEPLMDDTDIMALAARMRRMQQDGEPGPLAVVMPRARHAQFGRMLGILAVPNRPIRFFSEPRAARAWLEEPEVRGWSRQ